MRCSASRWNGFWRKSSDKMRRGSHPPLVGESDVFRLHVEIGSTCSFGRHRLTPVHSTSFPGVDLPCADGKTAIADVVDADSCPSGGAGATRCSLRISRSKSTPVRLSRGDGPVNLYLHQSSPLAWLPSISRPSLNSTRCERCPPRGVDGKGERHVRRWQRIASCAIYSSFSI